MKKFCGTFLTAAVVLLTLFCFASSTVNAQPSGPSLGAPVPPRPPSSPCREAVPSRTAPTTIPACPCNLATPLFDTLPLALDDFVAFRPLGFLSPPIHIFPAKHSAFSIRLPGAPPVSKPIQAPGKIWVSEIWEATFSTGGGNYQVFLYPCRDVRVYFGHLASISEKLKGALQQVTPVCNTFNDGTSTVTTCRYLNLALPLDSGETFGIGPDTSGIDFGITDFRRPPAAFIELEHYDYFYPYSASLIDYFVPEVKAALESKTGSVFGDQRRTAAPIGGDFMQDLPDTAQGNWFLPGKYHRNTTDLSGFLSLVHDYVDPTQPIMTIGNSIAGVEMGIYSFTVAAGGLINRDFNQVAADGNTYCYDNFLNGSPTRPLKKPKGILLLTMPTNKSLKIELRPGDSCQAVFDRMFTASATVFVR